LVQDLANSDHPPVNIDSGTTVEIGAASAVTVDFANGAGTNGTLVLDDAREFTGQIVGFTGDGTAANSDAIDLVDLHFATATETYAESSAGTGGTLTISDGTNTANLNFTGDYTLANFKFSDDGSDGTLIIDPPVAEPQSPDDQDPASVPNGEASSQYGNAIDALDKLIGTFNQPHGNAENVITTLHNELESGNKIELGNLIAPHGGEAAQLQQLVQNVTDSHGAPAASDQLQQLQQLFQDATNGQNPLTNAGQLQQLVQEVTSGHDPLVNSGEEVIHLPQIDPHHGFIHA